MKFLKGFLRLLLLLLIVFLSTGLLVKETSYQVNTSIDRPLQEVFTHFYAKKTHKEWQPNLQSIKALDIKEGVVGSLYELNMVKTTDTIRFIEKTIAYIPNKKLIFTLHSDQLFKTDDYEFQELGSTTVITKNVVYKSEDYLMQCLFPYLKNKFITLDKNYLDNFKSYIEKQ
ncbi:hypothetical protein GCM10011416_19030 [Polaribacter pacificus]|uniref:Polyketide cyclase / dehydrase and lipid transport n=1 Tax=Polaribacter pacificus TaxID=1775173 RepID=A0A917I032_9FLAO|nr:hypothetical protein [Polaribacter pacificus]GGH00606.1 hypothetical protein GCM10011416_19030 [Polaribacter pacificus]